MAILFYFDGVFFRMYVNIFFAYMQARAQSILMFSKLILL